MSSIFERWASRRPVEMVEVLNLERVPRRAGSARWLCPVAEKGRDQGMLFSGVSWYCHQCGTGGNGAASLVGHCLEIADSAQLALELERIDQRLGVAMPPPVKAELVPVRKADAGQAKAIWRQAQARRQQGCDWLARARGLRWDAAPVGWVAAGELPDWLRSYAPGCVIPLYSLSTGEVRNAVVRAEALAEGQVKYMPVIAGEGSMVDEAGLPLVYQVPRRDTLVFLVEGAVDSLIMAWVAQRMGDGVSVAGCRCAGDIGKVAAHVATLGGVSLFCLPHRDLAHVADRCLSGGAGLEACAEVVAAWPEDRAVMCCLPGEGNDVNDYVRTYGQQALLDLVMAWLGR